MVLMGSRAHNPAVFKRFVLPKNKDVEYTTALSKAVSMLNCKSFYFHMCASEKLSSLHCLPILD